MTTFTDAYGDTLELEFIGSSVEFSAREGGVVASLEFGNQDAVQVAHAILEGTDTELQTAPAQAPVDPVTLLFGEIGNERFEWNRVAAIAASKLGLGIEFKYTKSEASPVEPRTLTCVNDVVETKDGNWVVLGHSDERDDERSFRLDRIVSYVQVS